MRLLARPSATVCPWCKDDLQALPGDECGRCRTRYHTECLADAGCSTLGCTGSGHPCAACDGPLGGARSQRCDRCGEAQHRECSAARGCRTPACAERWSVRFVRRTEPAPRPERHQHPAPSTERSALADVCLVVLTAVAALIAGAAGPLLFVEWLCG